jgi:hypothetical protein
MRRSSKEGLLEARDGESSRCPKFSVRATFWLLTKEVEMIDFRMSEPIVIETVEGAEDIDEGHDCRGGRREGRRIGTKRNET